MGGRRLETQRQKIPEKKMFYILGEANHPHPSSSSSSSYLVNNSVALHDKQMSDLYKIGMAQSHNYINSQVNKLGSSAPQLVIDTSHLDAERQVILRQLQESGLLPINSSEKHFVINQKFKKLMQRQHHPLPPPPRRLASLINEDIAAVPAAAEEIQHQPQQQHLSHHHHPLLLQRDSSVISTLDVPTTCEQGVGQMFPLDFFMENDSEFILENYSTTSTTTTTTNSSSSHFLLAKCHKLQDRWMQCIVEKYDAKSNAYLVAWTDVMMPYELKDVYKSWITRADMLLTPSESNSRRSFKLKHATALRFDFERCVAIHQFLGLVRPILQDKLPLFPTALVFQMAEKIVETMKSYRLFASTEQGNPAFGCVCINPPQQRLFFLPFPLLLQRLKLLETSSFLYARKSRVNTIGV